MLRFGPPRGFTHASACPWLGHPVSGLFIHTCRPIQARFHYASDKCLKLAYTNNSLDRSTKSTPSPYMRQTCGFSHRARCRNKFVTWAALFPLLGMKSFAIKKTDLPDVGLRLLVRTQFQDLFHSPSGVLLTFPSRYLYTIDRKIYLALEGGPSGFSQGFTCPDLLDKCR
jgi:hypothetical protein